MTRAEIQTYRLLNQNISNSNIADPDELVQKLCAIQAQDFPNSKWGIGVRIPSLHLEKVESALNDGALIRTWLFRGTIHMVSAKDIHWLMDLLAGRILLASRARNLQLGLDEKLLLKAMKLIDKLFDQSEIQSREEIRSFMAVNRIPVQDNLLSHILHHSAFNRQLNFGPPRGSELTYVRFDSSLSKNQLKSKDEALALLAKRYFTAHGPATLSDFTWWSGLTLKDARRALELSRINLIAIKYEDKELWMPVKHKVPGKNTELYLLPAFDAYLIAYRDRSILLDDPDTSKVISTNGIFRPIIVYKGKIVGIWSRTVKKNILTIEAGFFTNPDKIVSSKLIEASRQFARFLQKEAGELIIHKRVL